MSKHLFSGGGIGLSTLVFIEGIIGSGKTTLMAQLKNDLYYKKYKVYCFQEHKVDNPLDITRKAFITKAQYQDLISSFNSVNDGKFSHVIEEELLKNTILYEGKYVVAYSQIHTADIHIRRIIDDLQQYEYCYGKIDCQHYESCLLSIYRNLRLQEGYINIFEGALLQNPLYDLITYYQYDVQHLVDFVQRLIDTLSSNKIIIKYITSNDVSSTITRAAQHRGKEWLERLVCGLELTPYGVEHNLQGFDGCITYCQYLQKVTIELLNNLHGIEIEYLEMH